MATLPASALDETPQETLNALDCLADQTDSLNDFLASLLPAITCPLSAEAGVIWLTDAQGNLRPAFQERWKQIAISTNALRREKHQALVLEAADSTQASLIGPYNRDDSDLPMKATFAFAPLLRDNCLLGLLELVLPASTPQAYRGEILEVLETCAGHVAMFEHTARGCVSSANPAMFLEALEPLLLRIYEHLDSRLLASEASNGIRDLLGVDRVTVLVTKRKSPQVIAVSGQTQVSSYSGTVHTLRDLVGDVLRSESSLLYAQSTCIPDSVSADKVTDYLEEAGSQMLAVVPVVSPATQDEEQSAPAEQNKANRQLIGALVLERMGNSRFDAAHQQALNVIAAHLGNGLHKAVSHERIFLLPVARTLGRVCHWVYRRQFWTSLLLLCCLFTVTATLILMSWDYRVTADGVLMPEQQRQVFAPWDAEVREVLVNSGESVRTGTPLVQLVSKELEAEELRLRTLLQEKQTSLRALRIAREASMQSGESEHVLEIDGSYAEHLVEIRHLDLQHAEVQSRLNSLLVTAPVDGVIATFQIRELLQHRPVNRGDLLLEVIDPESAWQVELELEDRRVGHLLTAQKTADTVPAEFILATNPEQTFTGKLKAIGVRSHPATDGQIVEIVVSLADGGNQLPPLRMGAKVTAKLNCGPKPVGYVLFGDVIDFLRTQLWL